MEAIIPGRRRVQPGSFSSHFDELVAQFPSDETPPLPASSPADRLPKLQEKIDIHALLFRQAWQLDEQG